MGVEADQHTYGALPKLALAGIGSILLLALSTGAGLASSGNAGIHLSKTVDAGGTTLAPVLNLTFAVDKGSAIPGDTLTYSGAVTNTGATLGVSGRFTAAADAATTAEVKYYWDELQYCSTGCGQGNNVHWTSIAGFVASETGYQPITVPDQPKGMTVVAKSVSATGVTYPTSGDGILTTTISPLSTAIWTYQASIPLTPDQVAILSDPGQAAAVRNLVHFEVGVRNAAAAQPYEDNASISNPLAGKGAAAATGVSVTVTLPDGSTKVIDSTSVPAFAALAPGASAPYSTTYRVPAAAAKGASEADADYLKRLAALDGSSLNASATAKATGYSGPVTSSTLTATSVEHLPILGIAKTGPGAAKSGTTVHYSLGLSNSGSAAAASLTVTDTLSDGGQGTVTGAPASLAPAGTATADAAYAIPQLGAAETLTDTASVAWTDANQNSYGPVSSAFATQVAAGVPPELTPVASTTVTGNFFAEPSSAQQFAAKPGDTPAFGQSFSNIAFDPPTGLIQYTPAGVAPGTRPFTDVTTNLLGQFTGTSVAQGNGVQAGVGTLQTFNAVFTAQFVVQKAGDVSFNVITNDGFLLGVGGGAVRVSGAYENPPASNATPFNGYPLMGTYNLPGGSTPGTYPVTVHFPAAGVYPYELDYMSCCNAALSLVLTVATFTEQTSPLSIYVGYADGLRPAGSIFPFPWRGSQNVNFIGFNGTFDAGAIRFDNSSDSPINIDSVTVNVGPVLGGGGIWGNGPLVVPPHQILILSETQDDNFDTSDWYAGGCGSGNGVIPVVHVTIAGVTTDYKDTNQVLNTFGYDLACRGNESLSWQRIGGGGTAINVPLPPAVALSITPASVAGDVVGQTQSFTAAAMDGTGKPVANLPVTLGIFGANTQQQTVNTDAGGLATFSYIGHTSGSDVVSATAFISGLRAASNSVTVPWAIPVPGGGSTGGTPDQAPPSIGAPTPADGARITAPTSISAGITPPTGHSIATWSVVATGDTGGSPITLASGTGAPPTPLATIDPTILLNDTYTLTITATTDAGGTQVLQSSVVVAGNLKLGRSVTSYRDLTVPVNGFQMEVNRVYDSTDTRTGDFGVGWHLDLGNFRVSTNRPLGAGGWTEYPTSCFILCSWAFKSAAPHYVTVTFPDGHQEVFDLAPPATGLTLVDFASSTAAFTARAGTLSKLSVANAADQNLVNGFDGNLYTPGGSLYNPTQFVLTTSDGHTLTLDTNRGLLAESDASGNTLTIDAAGVHSSTGRSITYNRDSSGRITSVTGPSGQHLSYAYSAAGDLVTFTNPAGGVSTYAYDANHHLLSNTGGPGTFTENYDAGGRLVSITDANGNTTQLTNDVNGRTQTSVDPAAAMTTVDLFDDNGDLVKETRVHDGTSQVYSFTYDNLGRVLSSVDPTGATTTVTYDANGNVLSVTDASGATTHYAYDSTGHLTSVTRPDGVVDTSMTYDALGRVLTESSADGLSTTYGYDGAGRPTTITSNRNGTTTVAYDNNGDMTAITNPLGATATMTYDAGGHVLSVSGPLGVTTTYAYDALGDPTSITDATGHGQTATYDSFGQMTAMHDSAGHTGTLSYDASGHLVSSTDALGVTTAYTYDADGRLVGRSAGGDTQSYTYDGAGRLVGANNAAATIAVSYDAADRAIAQTESGPGLPTTTVGNSYDATGRITGITGPQGTSKRTYDSVGRLISVADSTGTYSFTYTAGSELATLTRPNGAVDTFTYDAGGRLTQRTTTAAGGATLDSLSYTYTASGQIATRTENADTATYSYDAAGRLVGVQHTDPLRPNETFTYDSRGNRLSWSGASGTYVYNNDDQLLTSPTATYTYDAVGQRTSAVSGGSTTSYTWNPSHRLASVAAPGGSSVTYGYDALGRRVSVNDGTTNQAFVYSGDQVLARYANGSLQSAFTPGATNVPLDTVQGSQSFSYLADEQGSVTGLLDSSGAVVQRYSYSAYGVPQSSGGSVSNPFTYVGLQFDSTAGAYYANARYYDPQNGAFLSRDPRPSINPYSYAGGDPIDFSDPSGLQTEYGSILRFDLDWGERALGCVAGILGVAVSNAIVDIAKQQAPDASQWKQVGADAGLSCALGAVFPAFGRGKSIIGSVFPDLAADAAASLLRGKLIYMGISAVVAFMFGFALDVINQAICGNGINWTHAVAAGFWSIPGGFLGGGAGILSVGASSGASTAYTLGGGFLGGATGAGQGLTENPKPCKA